MAIRVRIPKDLNNIKEKIALNLTKRQLIWFPIGIAVGGIAFFVTKSISTELAVTLLVLFTMPFMFIAMYEKDGFFIEDIIKHYFTANFYMPKIRIYKSQNIFLEIENQRKLNREVKKLAKKRH